MNTVKVVNLADKPNNNIGKPKPMNQTKTFPILYSLRNCPYAMQARVEVRQWLNNYLQSPIFTKVMAKYPLWLDSYQEILFGEV
jgi:hypothetical protein